MREHRKNESKSYAAHSGHLLLEYSRMFAIQMVRCNPLSGIHTLFKREHSTTTETQGTKIQYAAKIPQPQNRTEIWLQPQDVLRSTGHSWQ